MEFIEVTLCEEITGDKPISQTGKIEGYRLPVYGIKSVAERQSEPGVYYIYICDSHIPTDFDFKVGHALAKLPKSFFDIVN